MNLISRFSMQKLFVVISTLMNLPLNSLTRRQKMLLSLISILILGSVTSIAFRNALQRESASQALLDDERASKFKSNMAHREGLLPTPRVVHLPLPHPVLEKQYVDAKNSAGDHLKINFSIPIAEVTRTIGDNGQISGLELNLLESAQSEVTPGLAITIHMHFADWSRTHLVLKRFVSNAHFRGVVIDKAIPQNPEQPGVNVSLRLRWESNS